VRRIYFIHEINGRGDRILNCDSYVPNYSICPGDTLCEARFKGFWRACQASAGMQGRAGLPGLRGAIWADIGAHNMNCTILGDRAVSVSSASTVCW
jgi:hypothetical protein